MEPQSHPRTRKFHNVLNGRRQKQMPKSNLTQCYTRKREQSVRGSVEDHRLSLSQSSLDLSLQSSPYLSLLLQISLSLDFSRSLPSPKCSSKIHQEKLHHFQTPPKKSSCEARIVQKARKVTNFPSYKQEQLAPHLSVQLRVCEKWCGVRECRVWCVQGS